MGDEKSEEGIYYCLGTVPLRWNGFNYLVCLCYLLSLYLSLSLGPKTFCRSSQVARARWTSEEIDPHHHALQSTFHVFGTFR